MGEIAKAILPIAAVVAAPFTAGTSLAWLPAAIGGAGTLLSMGQQDNAAGAYQTNQGNALAGTESLAQQLAQGPTTQPILDAGTSAIKTFDSRSGGVPNEGAMVKSLFGDNILNADKAAAGQQSSNLEGAIRAMLGTSQGYGNMATGAASAAQAGGNPYSGIFSALTQLGKKTPSPGGNPIVNMPQPGGGTQISGPDTGGAPAANWG